MIRRIVTCVLVFIAVCVNVAIAEDIKVTAQVGNEEYDHHPELAEIEDNIVTRVELEIKNDLDTLNLIILEFPVVP